MIYETTNTKQNQSLKSPNTPLKTDPKTQPTPSQHPSKKKSIHPPDTSPHHPQHPHPPSPSPPITQNTFTYPPLRKITPLRFNSCKFVKFVDQFVKFVDQFVNPIRTIKKFVQIREIRGQIRGPISGPPTPQKTTPSNTLLYGDYLHQTHQVLSNSSKLLASSISTSGKYHHFA